MDKKGLLALNVTYKLKKKQKNTYFPARDQTGVLLHTKLTLYHVTMKYSWYCKAALISYI